MASQGAKTCCRGKDRAGTPHIPREIGDTEMTAVLDSLRRIGRRKVLGYLPPCAITEVSQIDPATLLAAATSNGLAATCRGPDRRHIESGALYVNDREALGEVPERAARTLHRHRLPFDPERFVQHIAANWFESDHPAHPVIAAPFVFGH